MIDILLEKEIDKVKERELLELETAIKELRNPTGKTPAIFYREEVQVWDYSED